MFPLISLMVPLFKLMREAGLLNTYPALVLPYAVLSLPVCTLVMASFFQDIPPDLEAAAMVDGCSRVGALFRVVIPLSAPGVFTAAILAFVNAWDEFLLALTMMNRASMRTLSVGITLYQGEFAFPWPLISAALVIAIVPICILIAVFQERVVGGLTSGGVRDKRSITREMDCTECVNIMLRFARQSRVGTSVDIERHRDVDCTT